MISGIIAFGIFITNPTGVKDAPYDTTVRYIEEGKKVPAIFDDSEDCLDELKDIRKDLKKKAAELEAISGHEADNVDEEALNLEINSMRCLGINRFGKVVEQDGPSATPAAKAKPNTVDVWRIGRFDSEHVFHGTVYDTRIYLELPTCKSGLRKAANTVADKAIKEGASGSQTVTMVSRFRETYSCEQITISQKAFDERLLTTEVEEEVLPSAKQAATVAQPVRVPEQSPYDSAQPSPQVIEAQPNNGFYQIPSPAQTPLPTSPTAQYRNYPLGLPQVPTRPYYMAENTRGYDGTWRWVKYQSVFQSPAQCWQAVREFLTNEEQSIQRGYSAMQPSYGAADWYRTSMDALTYRRKHLSCVTSDN